jgi:preprotein translocase SecE subunit
MEEMRKCTWPTRDQLLESTVLVLVVMVVSSAFIYGVDQILYNILIHLL